MTEPHKIANRQTWIACILLVLLTIPLCINLFHNRLINGPDSMQGLIMAMYMDKYIGDGGQFLIRWASDVNYGYGYPMFDFYMPFFHLISVILSKLLHDVILAVNLSCAIFWVLSGISMYFFAREFWGHRGGFLSAVAYLYAPYHIQDLYARGAFPEFSAFTFFPLFLLSLYKLNQRFQKRYMLLGGVSSFLLFITHSLMAILFYPLAVGYLIFLYCFNRKLVNLLIGFFVLGIGFLMSAFYWIPAFWDRQYLNLSFMVSMRNDFHKHFLSLGQLFQLPWLRVGESDGFSFQISLVILLLVLIPLCALSRINAKNNEAKRHYFFLFSMMLIMVFFTLHASVAFWEHIGLLKFIQFPWRILAVISFVVSFLAGGSILVFKQRRVSNMFLAIAIAGIIFFSVRFIDKVDFLNVDQKALSNNLTSYLTLGEGRTTPKWILIPPTAIPKEKFEIVRGGAVFSQHEIVSSIEHKIQVNASQSSMVCFHSFYFPGWRVYVDGQETQIYPENPYGLILFIVNSGEHTIKVVLRQTTISVVATIVSWFGLTIFVAGIFFIPYIRVRKGNKLMASC